MGGRALGYSYDPIFDRVTSITDPSGRALAYAYDTAGNLSSVTYPSDTSPSPVRTYVYNEPANTGGANLRSHVTGIIDENGNRFSTYAHDADGRATLSERAGSTSRYTVAYGAGGISTVTDPQNTARVFGFQNLLGVRKPTGVDQPCDGCGVPPAVTYDANGNVATRTDWNGNRADYTYDLARNLETSRSEGLTSTGAPTPQTRTVTTAWHASYRLPVQVAEPLRITTNVYGDPADPNPGNRGSLLSRTVQATTDATGAQGLSATLTGSPRTWTYTYNANGRVLSVDGPRTDVSDLTTYTYDLQGNVATITNAASHLTSFTSYNAHGQPLTLVDPNGVTTTLAYDARQRLTSRTFGGETTTYDYDGVGQLTKVTLPDGSFLSYSYDAAHRLTGLQDNQGNRIAYTLDAMGNRTQEQVLDPASALAQTRSRVYSNLNRLFQELGAQNQTTEYGYDNQGNVTSVKDPLNRITANQYDALNRLKQVTDPASGVTQYAYNGLDALTQVTDPRSLVTGYTVDGLGNLTLQASPDTGNTVNTYDAAGNLLTQTDAKGQVTSYAYDALNRVTLITFHDGSTQAYAYDQGANGIGRLTSITETNAANQQTSFIQYAYEAHGRVTAEARTVNGVQYSVAYSYDSAGRLSGITYPSGRTLAYTFDSLGRIGAISATFNGQSQQVVSSVAYHPFGGVKGYTLGNGQVYARSYDQDGRISTYTLGTKSFGIGYDAASRIEFISELGNPPNSNTYGYDSLDRLTSAVIPGTPFAYSYDPVGNRLSKTVGAATETLAYSSTSNRIATLTPASGPVRNFAFDANGSTTNDWVNSYAYDVRGRMVQATSTIGTTSYQVNALGQRVRKTNTQGDTVFHYDSGGRLIAETGAGGALKREILYLGDIPVGVVQ
jgi:YD repeat-containing protein